MHVVEQYSKKKLAIAIQELKTLVEQLTPGMSGTISIAIGFEDGNLTQVDSRIDKRDMKNEPA